MDKHKRYYGVILFLGVVFLLVFAAFKVLQPMYVKIDNLESKISKAETTLKEKKKDLSIVEAKIQKMKDSIAGSKKKIYSPVESDLGDDSLFFTLYNDVIEMVNANNVRIRTIKYEHNPESDSFVKFGKDVYFVSDVNMELVSNYVNLGKLIENIYQYPYYIRINEVNVKPYSKDKKILVTNLSLRLYAHTEPDDKE